MFWSRGWVLFDWVKRGGGGLLRGEGYACLGACFVVSLSKIMALRVGTVFTCDSAVYVRRGPLELEGVAVVFVEGSSLFGKKIKERIWRH